MSRNNHSHAPKSSQKPWKSGHYYKSIRGFSKCMGTSGLVSTNFWPYRVCNLLLTIVNSSSLDKSLGTRFFFITLSGISSKLIICKKNCKKIKVATYCVQMNRQWSMDLFPLHHIQDKCIWSALLLLSKVKLYLLSRMNQWFSIKKGTCCLVFSHVGCLSGSP